MDEQHSPPVVVHEERAWKWRYSRLMGIMYGPIPVGLIVVGIALVVYYAL